MRESKMQYQTGRGRKCEIDHSIHENVVCSQMTTMCSSNSGNEYFDAHSFIKSLK